MTRGAMGWWRCRSEWKTAAAVKATTTAMRNRNKFTVPDEIREMAAEAAQYGPSEKEVIAEEGS